LQYIIIIIIIIIIYSHKAARRPYSVSAFGEKNINVKSNYVY